MVEVTDTLRPGGLVEDDPLLSVLREGARRMLMQELSSQAMPRVFEPFFSKNGLATIKPQKHRYPAYETWTVMLDDAEGGHDGVDASIQSSVYDPARVFESRDDTVVASMVHGKDKARAGVVENMHIGGSSGFLLPSAT